ncbi:MAG TPA: hypothetical protein VKZ54_01000 [Membranihabitans sp.]|nr:hypothetical protein [Membranihabitans sp.]
MTGICVGKWPLSSSESLDVRTTDAYVFFFDIDHFPVTSNPGTGP